MLSSFGHLLPTTFALVHSFVITDTAFCLHSCLAGFKAIKRKMRVLFASLLAFHDRVEYHSSRTPQGEGPRVKYIPESEKYFLGRIVVG